MLHGTVFFSFQLSLCTDPNYAYIACGCSWQPGQCSTLTRPSKQVLKEVQKTKDSSQAAESTCCPLQNGVCEAYLHDLLTHFHLLHGHDPLINTVQHSLQFQLIQKSEKRLKQGGDP